MALRVRKIDDRTAALEGVLDIQRVGELTRILRDQPNVNWDLTGVREFDSAAALVFWEHWNQRLPEQVTLSARQRMLFDRIGDVAWHSSEPFPSRCDLRRRSARQRKTGNTLVGLLETVGRFFLDVLSVCRRPALFPAKECSAACYRSGVTALGIISIVGFLIGVVISYLSSLSLRNFGAESFLPMVMGIGIVRELGPLLTAIVLAGRSGSSITAGLGAMRLTQELDALSALGISHSRRLVLPRVLALALVTPLLVVCTNIAAIMGGLLSGWAELDLSPHAFLYGLRSDVPLSDVWIGLFKATVFGAAIGLIACHFGLRARANTQSLATHTTRSVVLSISVIILLDALFAIVFKDI